MRFSWASTEAKTEAIIDYRHDANPSLEFFEMYLEESEHGSMKSDTVYQIYLHWCKVKNLRPLGDRQFGKEIRRVLPKTNRRQKRNGRERYWSLEGIKFSVDEVAGKSTTEGDLF